MEDMVLILGFDSESTVHWFGYQLKIETKSEWSCGGSEIQSLNWILLHRQSQSDIDPPWPSSAPASLAIPILFPIQLLILLAGIEVILIRRP